MIKWHLFRIRWLLQNRKRWYNKTLMYKAMKKDWMKKCRKK